MLPMYRNIYSSARASPFSLSRLVEIFVYSKKPVFYAIILETMILSNAVNLCYIRKVEG